MKTLSRFLPVLAGLLLLAVPPLRAADEPVTPPPDDKPKHEGRGERGGPGAMMDHMAKELDLTADQQAKWKEIGQQEKTALAAIRHDASIAKEDKRAKAKETNKGFAEQRRTVLNADQQKKFDHLRAKAHERGGERGPKKEKKD